MLASLMGDFRAEIWMKWVSSKPWDTRTFQAGGWNVKASEAVERSGKWTD